MSANTNADPADVMQRAAVLGGGTIGLGIAQDAASLVEASRWGTSQGGNFRGYRNEDMTRMLRECDLPDTRMSRFLEKQSARDDKQETPA